MDTSGVFDAKFGRKLTIDLPKQWRAHHGGVLFVNGRIVSLQPPCCANGELRHPGDGGRFIDSNYVLHGFAPPTMRPN